MIHQNLKRLVDSNISPQQTKRQNIITAGDQPTRSNQQPYNTRHGVGDIKRIPAAVQFPFFNILHVNDAEAEGRVGEGEVF